MAKEMVAPRKWPPVALPIPVQCPGKGCERETALLLPGKPSIRAGIWIDYAWTAVNDPSDRSVVFVCAKCDAEGQASEQFRDESVRLPAER